MCLKTASRTLLLLFVTHFLALSVDAQVGGTSVSSTNDNDQVAGKKSKSETRDDSPYRAWFYVTYTSSYDSNINRDQSDLHSIGFVPSFGVHVERDSRDNSFELDYETAIHSYSGTDDWDRKSQRLRVSYERRLASRLYSKMTGEMSLKGSSEDRELANQYDMRQQFEYRLTRSNRLQFFGAYRLKRYDDEPERDSINPYVGVAYEQRLAGRRRWSLSYRYEPNRPQSPRNRYIRWTYGAEFRTPLFGRYDQLLVEAKLRPQLYARTIRLDGALVPRRDQRWMLGTAWQRPLGRNLRVELSYKYEARDSNDPAKKIMAHMANVTLTYRWWK